MTKPLYFWNGSSFELVGPTTPQSPFAYQTSAPTAPATGDIWIDSDGDVDTYNRQLTRYYFVATAGQTSVSGTDANGLTLAYVAGSEAVYVNGALQVRGVDYTATNGTSITGLSALALNDVVEVFAYTAFTVANAYTKSESDGLFATTTNFPAGAWTSYTPTLSNITLGNGTLDFEYVKLGKSVFVRGTFTMGSTSAMSTGPGFSLPVTAVSYSDRLIVGTCGVLDSGTEQYYGAIALTSTTVASCRIYSVTGSNIRTAAIQSTVPMTWTTSDMLTVHFNYEAA